MKERDWGVVQMMYVEADTDTALRSAIAIMLTYEGSIRAYAVEPATDTRLPTLRLFAGDYSKKYSEFLSPLKTVDDVFAEVKRWLSNVDYGQEPTRCDGSNKKGFLFSNFQMKKWDFKNPEYPIDMSYDGWIIRPAWIYYGK